jgi:hypothetical protein
MPTSCSSEAGSPKKCAAIGAIARRLSATAIVGRSFPAFPSASFVLSTS